MPSEITIGGVTFKVKIVKSNPVDADRRHVMGTISHINQEICIDGSTGHDYQGVTFWHEVLHAIFNAMNVGNRHVDVDEDFIDTLAGFVYQVYRQLECSGDSCVQGDVDERIGGTTD